MIFFIHYEAELEFSGSDSLLTSFLQFEKYFISSKKLLDVLGIKAYSIIQIVPYIAVIYKKV